MYKVHEFNKKAQIYNTNKAGYVSNSYVSKVWH